MLTPGWALLLMVLSGFAGLGHQIVWTQQAAQWLGHESAAVLAVITAFFGGLALGAWWLGARVAGSAQPQRWYAGCEAVMALWALVLAFLMQPISAALLATIGPQPSLWWQWGVAFVGTFLLLLPATAAMGATLPAMLRCVAHTAPGRGANLAALYGANTLGAVLGVLATAFWLVPEFGLTRTAGVCATMNLLCAVVALTRVRRVDDAAEPSPIAASHPSGGAPAPWVLAATGLLGIGYEVLVVRVISQVTENTVYTFAMLLAVYLLGTAAGAAAYARSWWGARDSVGLRDRLLAALAASCLMGGLALAGAPQIHQAVLRQRGQA